MRRFRAVFWLVLACLTLCGLVSWAALLPLLRPAGFQSTSRDLEQQLADDLPSTVAKVDQFFQSRWRDEQLDPAELADELQVMRRLTLALAGTIPSLAEIRAYESEEGPNRLERWTLRLLDDRRFAEYFAERLAIVFAGQFEQKVPFYSHARFEAWIADQLAQGRPYHEWVAEMIAPSGPPTSNGGANFVTAELVQGEQYANRLAARTVRACLGQRIDCAECHDHPFDHWTQADFQGLAAFFAQVRTRSVRLEDDANRQHEVEDRRTLEKRVIEPRVPFHEDWLSQDDSRRRQLANWVTHPENRRFYRAIANRVWGLVFGRPLVSPVDSLPDPRESSGDQPVGDAGRTDMTELLDLLAEDLRSHHGDLRRLVIVITSSRPFRLASTHPLLETGSEADVDRLQDTWAAFPLVRLRPEQLARALEQAGSLRTIAPGNNVWTLVRREIWMRKFIEQYGALDENELEENTDSIPQTIHRMYSRYTREQSRARWNTAAGRIAVAMASDPSVVEVCYLTCLSRRPTIAEQECFLEQLGQTTGNGRSRVVEDMFWTLFNSPEFGWNH